MASKEAQQMLESFGRAFKAGDLAAAGVRTEEERCVETLQKLATAEFPREILLKSQVGPRLFQLKENHRSRNIQNASAAVFDALKLRLYRGPKKPEPAVKKPPLPQKTESSNKLQSTNVFELFQRAFKASATCEERCVDGLNRLMKMELPEDLELLTYMGNGLDKLRETHPSSAVRKVSAAVQNAVIGRVYRMKIPSAVRPEVKRLQKSKIRRVARPVLQHRSNLVKSY